MSYMFSSVSLQVDRANQSGLYMYCRIASPQAARNDGNHPPSTLQTPNSSSVVLYFGSFNPVHNGHLAVAEYVVGRNLCDELWFVVSPRNPLKSDDMLAGEDDRLEMVKIAAAGSRFPGRLKACDVEFGLPRPSYTIDTLAALDVMYPDVSFSLLCGSDITGQIEQWKEWRRLTGNYKIYVYPREGYVTVHPERFTVLCGAPCLDYSSTGIREVLEEGGDISGMVPAGVACYIKGHKLWK